jgi:hypothetical protein
MSEDVIEVKPNRKTRRAGTRSYNDVIGYACGRCKKPFVAPLAEKCQCKVLTPFELQGVQV